MSEPIDQVARDAAVNNIDQTTFISAGAGGGKSTTLVLRLVERLLDQNSPVELRNIAAITFTERAGNELRERVRAKLIELNESKSIAKLQKAIDDLDSANIGTIHSFARQILSRYPIESGLPLEFSILDDSGSKRMIEDLSREVLDSFIKEFIPTDQLAAFKKDLTVNQLQNIVKEVYKQQHRLDDSHFQSVAFVDPQQAIHTLSETLSECMNFAEYDQTTLTPGYYKKVDEGFTEFFELIDIGDYSIESVRDFEMAYKKIMSPDQKSPKNAPFSTKLKDKLDPDFFKYLLFSLRNEVVVRQALSHSWAAVKHNLVKRVEAGNITFDELLLLVVRLLKTNPEIRKNIHDQYKLVIIDEFQDTDPLQWEFALLITSNPSSELIEPVPGSLVLVGDAQQSIYSFRGADLSTFEAAMTQVETTFKGTQSLRFNVNFRSTDGILRWVNSCFDVLNLGIPFSPLESSAGNSVGKAFGPSVHVLTAPDRGYLSYQNEAKAVASSIRGAVESKWPVRSGKDASSGSREISFGDFALLLPTRTILGQILTALEDYRIPYRSNDAAIVYDRPIVKGLISALKVISGFGVPLDLWFTLKSPLFGCTDTDLLKYKQSGGKWTIFNTHTIADSQCVVSRALSTLGQIAKRNLNPQPSQVFQDLVSTCEVHATYHQVVRGSFELDCVDMVVQHALKWENSGGTGLVDYSNWLQETLDDNSRERLPEIDDEADSAVRISTVHAVKGLEFPAVVLAGLGVNRNRSTPLLALDGDKLEFCFKSDMMSHGYGSQLLEREREKKDQENLRVLYVAATRAKDHLLVSGARKVSATGIENDWGALIKDGIRQTLDSDLAETISEILDPIQTDWFEVAETAPVDKSWVEKLETGRHHSFKKFVKSPSYLHTSVQTSTPIISLVDDESVIDAPDVDEESLSGSDVAKLGTAFHEVMEEVLLHRIDSDKSALALKIHGSLARIEFLEHEERLSKMVSAAISSDYIQRAFKASKVWPELSVFASSGEVDDVITEGFADLVFQDDRGLVLLDYKTNIELTPEKIANYKLQLEAYAVIISEATGLEVEERVLLHVSKDAAQAHLV
jgi:ATP-dependent helicase/nuclease subunit A